MGISELFLFITAVTFTGLGYWIGREKTVENVAETMIDKLIDDGYIKTKGTGDNLEILKYWEE